VAAKSFFTRLGNPEKTADSAPVSADRVDLRRPLPWIVAAAAIAMAACTGVTGDEDSSSSASSISGRWRLPADVAEIGADVRITYEGAPKWTGTSGCSGKLREGSRRLGNFLKRVQFSDEVSSIGGYACRRNTANSSEMSVHGTGRALDVFIPTIGGKADNTRGDKVANWLVKHSEEIGVDLIIWDRSIWRANGTNESPYGGPVPHVDHLHVEITTEAAAGKTPWFMAGSDGMAVSEEEDADGGTENAGEETESEEADGGAAPTADAGTPTPTPTADAGAPSQPSQPAQPAQPAEPEAQTDTPAPGDDGTNHEDHSAEEEGPGEVDSLGLGTNKDGSQPKSSGGGSWSGAVDDDQAQGCTVAPTTHGDSPALPIGSLGLGFAVLACVRRRRA
jgi:hypothetical protein